MKVYEIFVKTLIVITTILLLSPYFWLFGIPIYLVNIFLINSTKLPKETKQKWSFMPIGILFLFFLLIWIGVNLMNGYE